MKNVLIISYYWPPSGGAGVQRWLKLSKYLSLQGVDVHVLTVNPNKASYTSLDKSLLKDVHKNVSVHKTDSFEIINYYSKIVGKKNVPKAGFSNVNNKNPLQQIVNSLRSNLFIPDPRKGWNKFAFQKAIQIINEYDIKTIITSSPPHSTQLIGLKLKKQFNIKWIADLRDPWTDIYYYNLLGHSKLSCLIDKKYEKKVLLNSDKILTVSQGLKDIFLLKSDKIVSSKINILPNGYDKIDFDVDLQESKAVKDFIITYTGTMSSQYDPYVFFEALNNCHSNELNIILRVVGSVSDDILVYLKTCNFKLELINTVPHNEIIRYQKLADLLLLVIPNIKFAKGILTGKLFEYLASENQIIAIIPDDSDVVNIIANCNSGNSFTRLQKEDIQKSITFSIQNKINNIEIEVNKEEISKFSRENQAIQVMQLL